MPRRIRVELVRDVELAVPEFLRTGTSFAICSERHCWPPLPTMNAFLACGIDDLAGGGTMRWQPFALREAEYRAALPAVDPACRVDALGVAPGDWRGWFARAVALPPA